MVTWPRISALSRVRESAATCAASSRSSRSPAWSLPTVTLSIWSASLLMVFENWRSDARRLGRACQIAVARGIRGYARRRKVYVCTSQHENDQVYTENVTEYF